MGAVSCWTPSKSIPSYETATTFLAKVLHRPHLNRYHLPCHRSTLLPLGSSSSSSQSRQFSTNPTKSSPQIRIWIPKNPSSHRPSRNLTMSKPPSKRRAAPIRSYSDHKTPSPASPSASIILISPTNQILLLHRMQTSSAFPSAHVFPGGNLTPSDGSIPSSPTDINRHIESEAYRVGAIRELFEESGILLARSSGNLHSKLLEVSPSERKRARKQIHNDELDIRTWLKTINQEAVLDTDALIPFTHWITPPNVPKRYTTQMYVYFVPLDQAKNLSLTTATSDEVETMAADWYSASQWISRAQKGEIILFPPQFLLLSMAAEFLDRKTNTNSNSGSDTAENKTPNHQGLEEAKDPEEIHSRRESFRKFIENEGSPVPWKDKFISPIGLQFGREDGRAVLGLDKPGPELKDSHLKGEDERVVLVRFKKEGPREVEVRWKKEIFEEERVRKAALGEKKEKGKGESKL